MAIAFKIDQIIKEATHTLLHHLCIVTPLIRSVHFGVRLRDCLIDQSIRAGQTTKIHTNTKTNKQTNKQEQQNTQCSHGRRD